MSERSGLMWESETPERGENLACGEVYLKLGGIEQAGRCFYSDNIDTGFGPGPFRVSFAVADDCGFENGLLTEERLLFGDSRVFAQTPYIPGIPAVQIGVCANPANGTFRLGVMLMENAVRCRLRIRWWAERIREPEAEKPASEEPPAFYISNAPKALKVGQKYQLSCAGPDGRGRVEWEILTPNGGEITSYGMYTAPERPGIYQVAAKLAETGQTAAIYLMVR